MSGVRIGRVAGIPIHLHWSTLLVVGLVTASLASVMLPEVSPDASPVVLVGAGLLGAIGLLASIVAHELAHGLLARRFGIDVPRIDLWILGGLAHLSREARTAGQEATIAVAGPLTSLAIGAAGLAGAFVFDGVPGAVLVYLGGLNVLLAVFNLLPGAPLDGGRVLRAALWARSGDPYRAGVQAATAGRWVGGGLAAAGAVMLFTGRGGFTLLIVGWFIAQSAAAERLLHRTQIELRDRSARSVTSPSAVLPEWSTAAWAYEQPDVATGGIVAVRDGEGRVYGYVTGAQLRAVHPDERRTVSLAELAVPIGTLPVVAADDRADGLLERLRSLAHAVVVRDAGGVIGFVTLAGLQRAMAPRR